MNLSVPKHIRYQQRDRANQRTGGEVIFWGGRHSPFLLSSWQVTAITWAKATMARHEVILESTEGPMSECQTRSVLTHTRTQPPRIRDRGSQEWAGRRATASRLGNPNIPEWSRLLDERSLQTETSRAPPNKTSLPPTCTLLLLLPFPSLIIYSFLLLLGLSRLSSEDEAN